MKIAAYFIAFARLAWLGLHFARGLTIIAYQRILRGHDWYYTPVGAAVIQKWMLQASHILAMDIETTGVVASHATVLVANHISWLDIVALSAFVPVTFVSKSDLESWPIISTLSKSTGTVFIKRGSLQAMHQTLSRLTEVIKHDRSTVFFPEGTTTIGVGVNKFHSGLFEVAHRSGCFLQPVAISYFRQGKQDLEIAPYVDDDHFLKHLWRLFMHGGTQIQLDFLDEIKTEGFTRQQLAEITNQRITEMVNFSVMIYQDYPPPSLDPAWCQYDSI